MQLDLVNLITVLIAAWLAGALANRFGYPSILGELLAGIILGPALLGWLEGSEALEVLAELGVLLMMLYVGMEIDPGELGKASWPGLLAAFGGFVTPFVLGYAAVVWLGGSDLEALFVAMAVGVTSLATKSRILIDLKLLETRIAHVLMAGALVADTATLLIFAGVIGVGTIGAIILTDLFWVAGRAILFFAVVAVIGLFGFPWVGQRLTGAGMTGRTMNFIGILVVALVFAEMAELAGLHGILGTFIAGLFLREGVLDRRLFREINGLVYDLSLGFLAPVFFVISGFEVTLDVFQTDLVLFLTVMAVAFVGKIVGTALFYLPSGYGWREGLTVGAGMNGRGAVEIIVAGIGLELGLISQEIFSILVFMAIFTTATVPVMLKWGTDWLRARGELVPSAAMRQGTVIIGAGSLARELAKQLAEVQPVWLIDNNPNHCRLAREEGLSVVRGNALNEDVLADANAAQARAVVALTGNAEVNVLAAQLAKNQFLVPEVYVALGGSELEGLERIVKDIDARPLFSWPADPVMEAALEGGGWSLERITSPGKDAGKEPPLGDLRRTVPLTVERDGELDLFTSMEELEPGDRVTYIDLAPERAS